MIYKRNYKVSNTYYNILVEEEKRKFSEKYKVDLNKFVDKNSKRNYAKYSFLAISLLIISMSGLSFLLSRITVSIPVVGEISNLHYLAWFAGAAVFGFFMKKALKSKEEGAKKALEWINQSIPKTNIQDNLDLKYSIFGSMNLGSNMRGKFKGYDFDFQYNTVASAGAGGTKASNGIRLLFKFNKPINSIKPFSIIEKEFRWEKIEGNTIDECFQKRFFLKGISLSELPEEIKKICLENDRSLFLNFSSNSISYENTSNAVYPAYTFYGKILFLEFLNDLRKILY